ncbi:hypothetical protein JCM19992_16130 [Thermostilla marina]
MPNTPPQLVAAGDIRPCRFVKIAAQHKAAECDANELPIGVSQQGTDKPEIENLSSATLAAAAGESLQIYSVGDVCLLEAGATINAGDRLKSDADGKGVPIATTGTALQNYGAVALQDGAAGELVRVFVLIGSERPALA